MCIAIKTQVKLEIFYRDNEDFQELSSRVQEVVLEDLVNSYCFTLDRDNEVLYITCEDEQEASDLASEILSEFEKYNLYS